MESQKIENTLNLSLDATNKEKEKSLNLGVGYDSQNNRWEVIVKYSGDITRLEDSRWQVVKLLNEYAIVLVDSQDLNSLASIPEVEYIEKPKSLYFERLNGKRTSCVLSVQDQTTNLKGKGILVGIIDSGIDFENMEFRNADGTTRLVALWDQSIDGNPPGGYLQGSEFTKEDINKYLQNEKIISSSNPGGIIDKVGGASEEKIVLNTLSKSKDFSGHGTEVAGIAVGTRGVASEADIIVVKLGNPRKGAFPRTSELMQGIDYMVRVALERKQPIAINISFGNTYGAHDGSSLLERYIDDISNYWKNTICIGAGNEGSTAGHAKGVLEEEEIKVVELAVSSRELSLNIQLWKGYEDEVEIAIISPSGKRIGPLISNMTTQRYRVDDTEILAYYGEPNPYSVLQEIYIELLPKFVYIDTGVWNIELIPKKIVTGVYNMWLPSYGAINIGTNFLEPEVNNTITIPATAKRVISVGAYNSLSGTYADFSGRGKLVNPMATKPDIVAPGVRVSTTAVGGGQVVVSGTSFSTPFATGAAALLMEWGIIRGNDPFLYGEKVKAYFRKGAEEVAGLRRYPNIETGWGALCVENSIPR